MSPITGSRLLVGDRIVAFTAPDAEYTVRRM